MGGLSTVSGYKALVLCGGVQRLDQNQCINQKITLLTDPLGVELGFPCGESKKRRAWHAQSLEILFRSSRNDKSSSKTTTTQGLELRPIRMCFRLCV